MHRFFIKSIIKDNQKKIIIDDLNDIKHISKALRVIVGEKLEVCDLNGVECIVKVETIEVDFVSCIVIEKLIKTRESNIKIDLFQGLAKGSKMDVIIQKSVELGINNIYPMKTKRSIVKLDKKSEIKKIERWQKISDEAAKQSKRSKLPEIKKLIDVSELENIIQNYDLVIVAYELETTKKLKEVLKNKDINSIAILIGPEGGFEDDEISNLLYLGAIPISLGKRILRTETAGMTCISILQYELGDLG